MYVSDRSHPNLNLPSHEWLERLSRYTFLGGFLLFSFILHSRQITTLWIYILAISSPINQTATSNSNSIFPLPQTLCGLLHSQLCCWLSRAE